MGNYIVNFAVYTMAMIGLIFFALMVYKKCSGFGMITSSKNKHISVEETLMLSPRKVLYLIRVENERFLIASDMDKTTFLAKIGENETLPKISEKISEDLTPKSSYKISDTPAASSVKKPKAKTAKPTPKVEKVEVSEITPDQIANVRKNSGQISKQTESSVVDLPTIVNFPKSKSESKDVLHNMLRKINE